jgi:Helicase conserved C-terminal domain
MSVLPTLMIKGKLVSPTGDPSLQPALDSWIPYEYILEWFRQRKHLTGIGARALILKSETASGKSTLLPPKILEAFVLGGKGPGIICTQPRIYTAKDNVLQMLANYKFLRLGDNVGWSTGEDKVRPRAVGLLSATIGTLAQQLKTWTDDQIMRRYKFILIDETHERDLQTDLTIYMLKSLLLRQQANVNCPFVVLMSATFEPESFLKYFNIPRADNFIWCRGEAAGFDEIWDWNEGRTVNNYPQAAAQVVERIIREGTADESERGDIFIFLPGAPEFRETTKYLNELNKKLATARKTGGGEMKLSGGVMSGKPSGEGTLHTVPTVHTIHTVPTTSCQLTGDDVCYCNVISGGAAPIVGTSIFSILPIESTAVKGNTQAMRWITTPLKDQHVVISGSTYIPERRVILTTNVAETGVTVSSIKYVIDAGFNRGVEFNPVLGVTALLTKPAPQSRIRQRKGRAGRKFRGVFYPLYPQYIYDKLPVNQFPQIITSDISSIILDIVFEQLRAKVQIGIPATFRLADIDMVDVPAVDALNSAIEKLFAIGFLRYNPAPWTGPTIAEARAIVDPPLKISTLVPTNSIDNNIPVQTIGFTRLGAIAAFISNPTLSPESIRMIFGAYSWGVDIAEIITIAAYIEIDPQKSLQRTVDGKKMMIDWNVIYKDAFPQIETSSLRIITMDEFIDGLVLFIAVRNVVRADNPLNKLSKWCDKVGIASETIFKFITDRDELIDHFLVNEFSINIRAQKLAEASNVEYTDVVTRIKHCIYDGFRCGLLTVGSDGKYKSATGVSVSAPKFLAAKHKNIEMKGRVKPQYIIARSIGVKYNREVDIYEATPGLTSVMDGFVAVDTDFTI